MEGLRASVLFALVFPFVLLKIILSAAKATKPNLKLPPSPPKLPFFGNLHQLGKDPFASIAHFAEKLGPIYSLQLGEIRLVVVSSPALAREVLKTQDLTFCSRQQLLAFREFSYNGTSVSFSPYGSYWRYTKKILTTEVLSAKRVREYEFVRKEQLCRLVQRITTCYPKTTNLTKLLTRYTNDVICSTVLGRNFSDDGEYDRHGFHEMLREIDQVALDGFGISEYFPSMQFIHTLTGYKSRLQKLSRRFDNFFNEIIEEHLDPQKIEKREKDLLDVLLNIQKDKTGELALTMNNVKAIIMDMFIAGTSSASFVINSAMIELFLNPEVVRERILKGVVLRRGNCRLVHLSISAYYGCPSECREVLRSILIATSGGSRNWGPSVHPLSLNENDSAPAMEPLEDMSVTFAMKRIGVMV
ncbi:hypothetical protein Ancab_002086 [Ancistrocladus abbreviatus]